MRAQLIAPDAADWRSFLAQNTHDFYHLPEYVGLDAIHQGGEPLAFLAEENGFAWLSPLILRPVDSPRSQGDVYYDAIGPYGYGGPLLRTPPGIDPASFVGAAIERLITELRAHRVVAAFFRLHPVIPTPLPALLPFGPIVHHGDTVIIDLTETPDQMWQQTRENHRRGIKSAERAGCTVEVDAHFQEIETFHEIYMETMRRVEAGSAYSFSLDYFLALKERLGDHVYLCVVRNEAAVMCAGLFTESCGVVQYHLGGTRDIYLKQQPSKLMFHSMRAWARERGNRVLNLGAGVGARNDALYHFKSGFSRQSAPFRTWRLIVDDRAYGRLVNQWETQHGIAADGPDGFFPAYRKPANPC